VKSIPIIDTGNCTIVRFFWSDKLLIAEDAKLEHLNFAILFTIADILWVKKKQDKCMLSENTENNEQKFNSPSIHPSCFIHPCKIFIHPGVNHSPG